VKSACVERPLCLVRQPLNQFVAGQVLCFRFKVARDNSGLARAEFIKIERGFVHVKCTGVIEPDWFGLEGLESRYPDLIFCLRPTSCFLWGTDEHDVPLGRFPFCHWFKDLTTPV
jgi:hypothetical protein